MQYNEVKYLLKRNQFMQEFLTLCFFLSFTIYHRNTCLPSEQHPNRTRRLSGLCSPFLSPSLLSQATACKSFHCFNSTLLISVFLMPFYYVFSILDSISWLSLCNIHLHGLWAPRIDGGCSKLLLIPGASCWTFLPPCASFFFSLFESF